MPFVGVDVGTFETKGVLVDSDGGVLAAARRRHGISTPRPGTSSTTPRRTGGPASRR
jgi:xylulokinase